MPSVIKIEIGIDDAATNATLLGKRRIVTRITAVMAIKNSLRKL